MVLEPPRVAIRVLPPIPAPAAFRGRFGGRYRQSDTLRLAKATTHVPPTRYVSQLPPRRLYPHNAGEVFSADSANGDAWERQRSPRFRRHNS